MNQAKRDQGQDISKGSFPVTYSYLKLLLKFLEPPHILPLCGDQTFGGGIYGGHLYSNSNHWLLWL